MNNVCLIGRLTKEPEVRSNEKSKVAKFTLAINRPGREEADYISCEAWNQRAELIEKYIHKGTQIAIKGSIKTGSYEDHNGNKVYTTSVLVESITFIGNNTPLKEEPKDNKETKKVKEEKNTDDLFAEFGEENQDVELPF